MLKPSRTYVEALEKFNGIEVRRENLTLARLVKGS